MTNNPSDELIWGTIKSMSSELLAMDLMYRGSERASGTQVMKWEEIDSLETENLSAHYMQIVPDNSNSIEHIIETKDDELVDFQKSRVASFLDERNETQAIGFLCDWDDQFIMVKRLDDFAREDGTSIFSRKSIKYIRYNGTLESDIQKILEAER